jgi:hypothetical protein
MRLVVSCLLLIFVASALPGCVCSITEDKEAAERTMNSVFECIRDRDYESALQYYSIEFFGETPEDQWTDILETINEKLGDLQSWDLDRWKTTRMTGTKCGTYVDMTYRTQYSKYDAVETVTLKKSGSAFKVLGHNINSEGFVASDNDANSTV